MQSSIRSGLQYGILLVFIALIIPWQAFGGIRTALVIGNAAYGSGPLKNPVNDAKDMAAALRKLGFAVIEKTDIGRREMIDAINDFYVRLRQGDAGLFYFAGHGMQINGRNFLIPVDVNPQYESAVEYDAIDAGRVMGSMRDAGTPLNIIILDACRDNPFAQSFRSGEKGLARMDAPRGSIIAYSTSPGSVAADGDGRNGVYTKYLLSYLVQPELPVEQVFKKTRIKVAEETRNGQIPWESSSLMGDFYFADSSGAKVSTPSGPSTAALLSVTSNIAGANVSIDERTIGMAPIIRKELSSGSHHVCVSKQGYDSYETRVIVESGWHVSLDAFLSPSAPAEGRLYVNADPSDARVRVLNINPAYSQGMQLAPGRYHVEVSKDGYETATQWVDVAAGEDRYLSVALKKSPVPVAEDFNLPYEASGNNTPSSNHRITNTLGMEFVYIEPGTFQMGSLFNEVGRDNDENPHRVTLTHGYYLQATELTQGQWKAVMGKNPSSFSNCGDDCPVESVSWEDVQEFIRKLNAREATNKYRLPTEAEWEYACRAGSSSVYCYGNSEKDLFRYAWYVSNSEHMTHPVAQKQANAWGLYDMHGNVWEWCSDWRGDYPSGSMTDPKGPSSGGIRISRGGSCNNDVQYCRSANRTSYLPCEKSLNLGFRLAFPPSPIGR